MFIPIQECELQSLYLWLKGKLSPRQRDDLTVVFVACPAERPNLVADFCKDLKAEHRLKAFYKYFNSIKQGSGYFEVCLC